MKRSFRGNLRRPEATSNPRLPHCIHFEISRLAGAEADEATCSNPYVWKCAVSVVLWRYKKGSGRLPHPPQP
jgi:hypothetical protein